MRFFATLWSLRKYPTAETEWSWARKFRAIRAAGFSGVMSPPIPVLRERGKLAYLAITSIDRVAQIEPAFTDAQALGAERLVVQLADFDTPLPACVDLVRAITAASRRYALPVDFENHRNTFTETPEKTWALVDEWKQLDPEPLPLCFDFSHYAVVRHLAPPYWPQLADRPEPIARARVFHLRPFNGHHCQIPVTLGGKGRAPEYLPWLEFAKDLFSHLRSSGSQDVIVVPELGHDAPAYRLSCFPDTWADTRALHEDLRRAWKTPRAHAAARQKKSKPRPKQAPRLNAPRTRRQPAD